jgi:hypothetical protein
MPARTLPLGFHAEGGTLRPTRRMQRTVHFLLEDGQVQTGNKE